MKRQQEEEDKENIPPTKRQQRPGQLVGNIPKTLHYSLHPNDSSWVETFPLPVPYRMIHENIDFKSFFDLFWRSQNPKEPTVSGLSYRMETFGRGSTPYQPIPVLFKAWLNFVNETTNYHQKFDQPFNKLSVYWLENKDNHIPHDHLDNIPHVTNDQEESCMVNISFGAPRELLLKGRTNVVGNLKLVLTCDTVVVIGGLTLSTHQSSIPKLNLDIGKHILLSFAIVKY